MTVNALKMYVGAGIILARQDEVCGYRFLLLKGRTTGIWSFSKGHPERIDRDSALRTAARETFEETGLSAGVDYTIYGNSVRFGKRPYWLGILATEALSIRLSSREHSAYAWMSLEEIGQIRSNIDVRAWVQKSQRGEFQRLLTISNELLTQRSQPISDTHSSA